MVDHVLIGAQIFLSLLIMWFRREKRGLHLQIVLLPKALGLHSKDLFESLGCFLGENICELSFPAV